MCQGGRVTGLAASLHTGPDTFEPDTVFVTASAALFTFTSPGQCQLTTSSSTPLLFPGECVRPRASWTPQHVLQFYEGCSSTSSVPASSPPGSLPGCQAACPWGTRSPAFSFFAGWLCPVLGRAWLFIPQHHPPPPLDGAPGGLDYF